MCHLGEEICFVLLPGVGDTGGKFAAGVTAIYVNLGNDGAP